MFPSGRSLSVLLVMQLLILASSTYPDSCPCFAFLLKDTNGDGWKSYADVAQYERDVRGRSIVSSRA